MLASSNNGTGQSTVQQVFENFVPGTTSQTQLTQYGSSFGYTDTHRVQKSLTGGVTSLPAGAFYLDGYSNTLYVHLSDGGVPGSSGHIITAANPSVLGLVSVAGSPTGDLINKLKILKSATTRESIRRLQRLLLIFKRGADTPLMTPARSRSQQQHAAALDSNIYYAATEMRRGGQLQRVPKVIRLQHLLCRAKTAWAPETSANFLVQKCDIEYSNARHFDTRLGRQRVKVIPTKSSTEP